MNKIVPIEPTEEMLDAIWKRSQINDQTSEAYEGVVKQNARIDYKAMLSAAPESDHIIVSKAELDALKADAERYKGIKEKLIRASPDMSGNHYWGLNVIRGNTLDEAIDKARGEV